MFIHSVEIDGGWLWDRLHAVARFGATPEGGVARLAFSEDERALIVELSKWTGELGCTLYTDEAANLFFRREGDCDLPPVVIGSHIDSQPTGGRYDGSYGVMAGLTLLEALERQNIRLKRPIEVVAWMNEEGCRFAPGTMGSSIFTGALSLEQARSISDHRGVSVGEELDKHLKLLEQLNAKRRAFGFPMHAFLEAHIEQGPVLETRRADVGIVTAAQGPIWYRVEVNGVAAHAGTTPRASRRDAVAGAMELAAAMRAEAMDAEDEIRFTIGTFNVEPSSINTVAGKVVFTIDLRHLDPAVLSRLNRRFHEHASKSWAGCTVILSEQMRSEPVHFDPVITQVLEEAAHRTRHVKLPSGAFHDAVRIAAHCPTGMLFIPCRDGVSHHQAEQIEKDQALAGAQVLANAVLALASSDRELQG